MGRGFIWSTSRFCAWAYIIQYLLSDLFLVMKETEFTSYADDNTLYDADNTIEDSFSNGFSIIKCKEIQENVI